ncbi:MAG: hypothetical protein V4801_15305 [Burkholderia gladioli]
MNARAGALPIKHVHVICLHLDSEQLRAQLDVIDRQFCAFLHGLGRLAPAVASESGQSRRQTLGLHCQKSAAQSLTVISSPVSNTQEIGHCGNAPAFDGVV